MTRDQAWDLVVHTTRSWVTDPASDVVGAEEYEGRWAVRMAQQVRDFTTVWFEVGERTVGYEAYVLPAPPAGREEVYRQCLFRNRDSWRAHFFLDRDGDLVLRGRLPLEHLTPAALDEVLGAIYELVELSFHSLVRNAFPRP